MKKYNIGVLIGRFQPFHKGHLYLIKKSLKLANKLIIAIGSINILDQNNPLNYQIRRKMANIVVTRENLQNKVIKVVPLRDNPSDDLWFDLAIRRTGLIDVAIGNNEWVNDIFEKRGYPVLRAGLYKRCLYESKKIRQLIREGKSWKDRVPEYLVEIIQKNLLSDKM